MRITILLPCITTVLFALGCGSDDAGGTNNPGSGDMTKDEARAASSKADGTDYCAWFGWYGDGVCDDFCAEPDPDCGGTCGGIANLPCDDGLYCELANCALPDAAGTCVEVPDACPQVIDPVCGCDGETYNNACAAAQHRVSVLHAGACDGGGEQACGGIAGILCADGQYCRMGDCSIPDATGVCEAIPDYCPQVIDPVCGCDAETYNNECEAARRGVSVLHAGTCDAGGGEGDMCGGFAGLQCGEGTYCRLADCAMPDASGTCEAIPEACPAVIDPVCGCDGATYDNACKAARQGVSVSHDGACD